MRYLRIIAGLPGLMLALGACGHASPAAEPMTVPAVIGRINALNGEIVRVKGYLGTCAGYDCSLFVNQADSDLWKRNVAAMRRHSEPEAPNPPMLGIGGAADFDLKAARFQNSPVLITGKVTNECRYLGKPACLDRTTDLVPTDIVPLKDS